jgi:hypothetical protein
VISDNENVLDAVDETKTEPEEIRLLYQFIEKLDELIGRLPKTVG